MVVGWFVVVFNDGGEYFVIDDFCLYMGALLGVGGLDDQGNVICFWYVWWFKVCDGIWIDNLWLKVDLFVVCIQDDEIQV